jgi:hypothetical protein
MKKLFILSFLFIIARALFAQNYYDSPGGRGIRLAVAAPAGKDLAAAETWLPRYAQGMFTGNFNKFSAMTIIALQDRSSVEAEQELSISGDFSDEDYIRIGNMTNAQFVLAGSIQDISGGRFSVQWSITELETGVARGAFSKICSFTELRNAFKVINDLLSGLETTKIAVFGTLTAGPSLTAQNFRNRKR